MYPEVKICKPHIVFHLLLLTSVDVILLSILSVQYYGCGSLLWPRNVSIKP